MNEINKVVKRAAWRLWLIDFWRTLAITLTIALAGVFITRLVERIFGLSLTFAPIWKYIFAGAGAAVLLGSLIWTIVIRRRDLAVARVVDERANLREALSTAMCVAKSDDPWSRAVVETAQEAARKVDVRSAIPYQAPRYWPVPIATAIALMIAWMTVPSMDVLGIFRKQKAAIDQKNEIVKINEERAIDQQKLDELMKRAKVDLGNEPTPEGADSKPDKEIDPESLRRSAVKELTSLTDKLNDMKEGEKAAQLEAMKDAMKQLRQPGPGPLDNVSRELAKGDFNKANQALEQLKQQMASNDMSPEQKKQLGEQAQNLAKQLEKLGNQQEQLAKKLEKAGLDKQSAEKMAQQMGQNPEGMKQALEQMKNLSPEQKEQLQKMAEAACKACEKAGQMSQSMSEMAKNMSQEGMQQQGMEAMEQLAQNLSNMEMMQSDMENLDAALDEAQAQLKKMSMAMGEGDGDGEGEEDDPFGEGKIGQWREGDKRYLGSGQGGPGRGNSPGGLEEEPADYAVDKTKANTQTQQGAIIGSRLVYGEQIRGESVAQFAEVVESGRKAASESIESGQVPREFQDAVKSYFSTLSKKAKGDGKPTPPPAPASDSKDAGKK